MQEQRTTQAAWKWQDAALLVVWAALGLFAAQNIGLVFPAFPALGLIALWYSWMLAGLLVAAKKRGGIQLFGLQRIPAWFWLLIPAIFGAQMVVLAIANALTGMLSGGFSNPQSENIQQLAGGNLLDPAQLIPLLLLNATLVPLVEELSFRGVLYPLMRQALPVWVAVGLNALLFAVIHRIPIIVPGLFALALVLTLVREYTGSILPGIVLHILQNVVSTLLIAVLPLLQSMPK